MKNLVFRKRLARKLTKRYVGLYVVEEVVVLRYRELVKGQKVEESKSVEVNKVEEWEVKKILNKRKV